MKYYLIGSELPSDLSEKFPALHTITELPEILTLEVFFIIHLIDVKQQDNWLAQLRQHPYFSLVPVFAVNHSPLSTYLADGGVPHDCVVKTEQYQQKLNQLRVDIHKGITERLLTYLWLWPERKLVIQAQPESISLYEYPLLNLWISHHEEYASWLYMLERDQFIRGDKLIDRVRYCPDCQSGHLNYIECCPECGSIDIEPESALHCFACGHVAGQDDFLNKGQLSCPNCLTQLRHIGVDYDRPIENYRCHDCNAFFVEGLVKARCLEHGHEYSPEALVTHSIRHYILDEEGEAYLRSGGARQLIPEWIGGNVSFDHFNWLLLWENKLAVRHQEEHLVVVLHFSSLRRAIVTLGDIKVASLMDDLIVRLQSVLRLTDVCCHYKNDTLLFFLPNTAHDHAALIQKKLREQSDRMVHETLQMSIQIGSLPTKSMGDSSELFIQQLISGLSE